MGTRIVLFRHCIFHVSTLRNISETNPLDEAILSDTISHMGDMAIRTGRKITWDPIAGKVKDDPEANQWFIREMREPYTV